MLSLLALALFQQPQAPRPTIQVTPSEAEVPVGGTLRLAARLFDAQGKEVAGARFRWFADGEGGAVDSTGLFRAGFKGTARVTVVTGAGGSPRPAPAMAVVRVVPSAAARIDVAGAPARLVAGARVTLAGTAFSAEGDRRDDAVAFSSGSPSVATVTPDGRLAAVAPGRATITARAGGAAWTHQVEVVPNTVTRLELEPGERAVRTGDVVRFTARGLDRAGRPVAGAVVRWGVTGGPATIDPDGGFVAEAPGTFTVSAFLGGQQADAVVRVAARGVGRGIEVLSRVPITFPTSEVWVHPAGRCAYLGTIADRVYAIDLEAAGGPAIVDSMLTDARIVNDVMTTEDGRWGVFSREGASNRKNGIVLFDASDACHPKPVGEYTETVSGGVHSSYVYRGHVYLTDDATGSMRVIDIRDPRAPREVGRFQTGQTEVGRYLHDVHVDDGLAYLSYWNDGLVILDVGNGMKGGSPARPVLVGQAKYDHDALYRRVEELWGLGSRGTHTAWRSGKYVFVGDEVYATRASAGLADGNDLTFGRLTVFDVSDITRPQMVAWYEPTDAGVHNIWVAGDTLYMGAYQGGARVLDISGELRGDLLRQGREVSWLATADAKGLKPRATFAWGAVVHGGRIFVPDINSGLWVLRLEPRKEATP
ncbi:MAG TPA: Ig-like domain-containing protein [Gemmatimonadales bacterium]|nr:Ig-like domain-containing protein [Gemmatimonadales bacterium]